VVDVASTEINLAIYLTRKAIPELASHYRYLPKKAIWSNPVNRVSLYQVSTYSVANSVSFPCTGDEVDDLIFTFKTHIVFIYSVCVFNCILFK